MTVLLGTDCSGAYTVLGEVIDGVMHHCGVKFTSRVALPTQRTPITERHYYGTASERSSLFHKWAAGAGVEIPNITIDRAWVGVVRS